jgi:type I restriction enzyme R subunit
VDHLHLDSEQALENATMGLFRSLGWTTANAFYEAFAPDEATPTRPYLGRHDETEVLLKDRLRPALETLNPDLPPAAIQAAASELDRGRSMMTPVQANRDVYRLLKNGVLVTYRDDEGREQAARVRAIDWNEPARNDFLMVQQFWVTSDLGRKRPDLVGFVNGIPLLFGELKAHHKRLINAYNHNLRDYKDTIARVFWYTGFVILSNGSQAVIGNLSAPFRHFGTWKKVADEKEQGVISLETLVRATCAPARLLDIVENFTLYHEGAKGLEKITAKNHQYLGVHNVIRAVEHIRDNQGRVSPASRRLGVFWHTQGSGKSFSMIFFAQRVLRKLGGNWTFVIVTDRKDLDDQIYKNFSRCGVVTEGEEQVRADSGADLKRLLREDHRYVFTLIQKFHTRDGRPYPVLSERDDVIVLTDEAHRTQYATLAMNMRRALPNAAFVGFTGTPLMADEVELTREVFGDYVSVYNFRQSVEDGATVPLYYENRIPEVQLTNEELTPDMETLLERADVDDEAEAALAREFVREYHVITRDDRLEKVAQDVVDHFFHRGYRGKAMVISIDKLTTGKMYDKVQKYWRRALDDLRARLETAPEAERAGLKDLIEYVESTDMAVVVSQGQNEVQTFAKHGLDVRPHRRRMMAEDLDEKFKDPDDPFRLAFVCAMWRTGFDAPACSTIYLDRPMRNHTLMQTIARANRVFGEKVNGLIVDYVGIFRELQRALAIYAAGKDEDEEGEEGDYPIQGKDALVDELREAVAGIEAFCEKRGVDVEPLLARTDAFQHVALMAGAAHRLVDARTEEALDDSVERIILNDGLKLRFLNLAAEVDRLFKAILPDPSAGEFGPKRRLFLYLAEKIRSLTPELEAPDVRAEVTSLLDESIEAREYVIREPPAAYDLSQVDFEALKEQFERGRKRTQAERLRGRLNAKLGHMVRRNRCRIDYYDEFQRLIDEYNGGSLNVETFFEQLVDFAQRLNEEDQRHIREGLSEGELALFDILTRPDMHLTGKEAQQVKQVARDLLATLTTEKLVLDWHKRQQSRAAVRLAIKEILYDRLPDRYTEDLCDQKRDDIYHHVYTNYYGAGRSVYGVAAA